MFGSCRLRVGGVSVSRKLSTRWQKLLCLGAVVGHGPARVRLRCAGVRGRNPRIRESRQRPLSGCRAPVWPAGCSRCLSAVSKSPKCLALTWHLGDSGCGDGTEISQLLEVHASWFDDFSEWADAVEDNRWNAKQTTQVLNSPLAPDLCFYSKIYELCNQIQCIHKHSIYVTYYFWFSILK